MVGIQADEPRPSVLQGPRGEGVCHVPPFSTGKGCGQREESETLHREPPELPGKSPQGFAVKRGLEAGKVFGELLPTGRVSGQARMPLEHAFFLLWPTPSLLRSPLFLTPGFTSHTG